MIPLRMNGRRSRNWPSADRDAKRHNRRKAESGEKIGLDEVVGRWNGGMITAGEECITKLICTFYMYKKKKTARGGPTNMIRSSSDANWAGRHVSKLDDDPCVTLCGLRPMIAPRDCVPCAKSGVEEPPGPKPQWKFRRRPWNCCTRTRQWLHFPSLAISVRPCAKSFPSRRPRWQSSPRQCTSRAGKCCRPWLPQSCPWSHEWIGSTTIGPDSWIGDLE